MASIQHSDLNYLVLPTDAYEKECSAIFNGGPKALDEAGQATFRRQVSSLQVELEKILVERWEQGNDWEVGAQCEVYYWLCGGIYSKRIFCVDYLLTISGFLLKTDLPGLWAYNTCCEIGFGEDYEDRGEFFQRGNDVYIDGELMKQEYRLLLGCPE